MGGPSIALDSNKPIIKGQFFSHLGKLPYDFLLDDMEQ